MLVCLEKNLEFDLDREVSFFDVAKHLIAPRRDIHFTKKPTGLSCHDAVDPNLLRRTVVAQFTTLDDSFSAEDGRTKVLQGRECRPLTATEFLVLLDGELPELPELEEVDTQIVILGSDFLDHDIDGNTYVMAFNPKKRVLSFHKHDHKWSEDTWLAVALC